jgi:hypothetical protein
MNYKLKTEEIYTPGNEKHFHHTILYECDADIISYVEDELNNILPPHGSCFDLLYGQDQEMANSANIYAPIRAKCNKIIQAWAVGGEYVNHFVHFYDYNFIIYS